MRILLPGACVLMLSTACGMSHNPVSAAPPSNGKAKKTHPVATGPSVSLSGASNLFVLPDTKRPGKVAAKLWAKYFKADAPTKTVSVTLIGVTGYLFQSGEPASKFTAPRANGDNVHQQIVATGRVNFTSLTKNGTSIDADRVVWSALTNKGTATGNVVVHYGQSGITLHTQKVYFDTRLRTVESGQTSGTIP